MGWFGGLWFVWGVLGGVGFLWYFLLPFVSCGYFAAAKICGQQLTLKTAVKALRAPANLTDPDQHPTGPPWHTQHPETSQGMDEAICLISSCLAHYQKCMQGMRENQRGSNQKKLLKRFVGNVKAQQTVFPIIANATCNRNPIFSAHCSRIYCYGSSLINCHATDRVRTRPGKGPSSQVCSS